MAERSRARQLDGRGMPQDRFGYRYEGSRWMTNEDASTLALNGYDSKTIAEMAKAPWSEVSPSVKETIDQSWSLRTAAHAARIVGKDFDPSKLPTPVGESPIEDRRGMTDEERLAAFDFDDSSLGRLAKIPGLMQRDLSGLYSSMFGSLVDDMPMGADIDARVKEAAERSQQLGIHIEPMERSKAVPAPLSLASVSTAPQAQTAPASRKEREQAAMDYFTSDQEIDGVTRPAYTKEQAAGIVGNLSWESGGLNTDGLGDGGLATGIAQWHDSPKSPRWSPLKAWAEARELDPRDLTTQFKMVDKEMLTTEKRAASKIRAATTVEEASAAMLHYERPGGFETGVENSMHYAERAQLAGQIASGYTKQEPGWFDKAVEAVQSFTGLTGEPDAPATAIPDAPSYMPERSIAPPTTFDKTPSVVAYKERVGIEDPSIAARARLAQQAAVPAEAPPARQLSEQDTQQADLDSFYDATNLEGVSVPQPGYSPPKAAPPSNPVQDLFSDVFGSAPNTLKPGQVQLGTEVVDSGAPTIDPSFTREQPAVTPKDPQLAGRLVPAESGIGMVEAAPPSVKQVRTVSIPVTPETVDPNAPPPNIFDKTPSVVSHAARIEAEAEANTPPPSPFDLTPSVAAAMAKVNPDRARINAELSSKLLEDSFAAVQASPLRPAPQSPAYNPLASMRPPAQTSVPTPVARPAEAGGIPMPPARPAPSLEQTMQEVKTKLDALTGGYDPTKSPRAAAPAAQAPTPAPAPPASPALPQSTIAAMRAAVEAPNGVPSLSTPTFRTDEKGVEHYVDRGFGDYDAVTAKALSPVFGDIGSNAIANMQPLTTPDLNAANQVMGQLPEEDIAAAWEKAFPTAEEVAPQEETAVDVAETQAQPNVSKRLPQRPAITPKPVDPDPIHNLEQPDFVAGAGVFDSEGNLVGRLDDEGNPVAKTGFFSGVKDIGKGALKGGSLFGIPGAILGAAIGGANSASNIFGGPEPKAHVELAHDTDVIGANGRAGKQSVTTGLLARVNALNLGKPPAGYKYGYSPLDEGVALVHDNAPEALKIASSGPGLFGALGLTGPGGTVRAPSPSKFFGSMFGTAPAKTGSGGGITNLGGIMSGYAQTTQDFANAADKIFGGSGGSTSPGGYRTSSEGGNLHG